MNDYEKIIYTILGAASSNFAAKKAFFGIISQL